MKLLRYALCFIVSFFGLYLLGIQNLVSAHDPTDALAIFLGIVLLVSFIVFAILEMYLNFKKKFDDLVYRVSELEEALSQKEE